MVAWARPHDLLVCAAAGLGLGNRAPAWAHAALARTPIVVVRHAPCDGALIPVGVRGRRRDERFGFYLELEAVLDHITPERLAFERAWENAGRSRLAPFAQLPLVEAVLSEFGLSWGPAGSVAFELASGLATVGPDSDLDLVIRLPERISTKNATRLHAALASERVRVDVRLDVPAGYVSLAELASGEAQLLLRTDAGPQLVRDPWR